MAGNNIEGEGKTAEPIEETPVDREVPLTVTPETQRSLARLLFGGFIKEVPDNKGTEK